MQCVRVDLFTTPHDVEITQCVQADLLMTPHDVEIMQFLRFDFLSRCHYATCPLGNIEYEPLTYLNIVIWADGPWTATQPNHVEYSGDRNTNNDMI